MLRKLSSPPFVILVDTLFLFLFITIFQSKSNDISFNIPNDKLFKNAELVFSTSNQAYWYSQEEHIWKDIRDMSEFTGGEFYYRINCNEQCPSLMLPTTEAGNLQIAITGKLYDKISGLAFLCRNCSHIKFTITPDGKIDKALFLEDNPDYYNKLNGISIEEYFSKTE